MSGEKEILYAIIYYEMNYDPWGIQKDEMVQKDFINFYDNYFIYK